MVSPLTFIIPAMAPKEGITPKEGSTEKSSFNSNIYFKSSLSLVDTPTVMIKKQVQNYTNLFQYFRINSVGVTCIL